MLILLMAAGAPAGIQGSGHRSFLAVGTVTSVDSAGISVSGVPYSTSGTSVEIDGAPGSQTQLQLGDVVTVSGTDGTGQSQAVADQVSFSGNVRGPVSTTDVSGGTFLVLGQTVRTDSQTLFSGSLKRAALAGIRPGDVVEVSGFENTQGEIVASRIDAEAANSSLRVTGAIQLLNMTQHTFRIDSLVVDFSNAAVQGFLADGVMAAVEAPAHGSPASLLASAVDVLPGLTSAPGSEGRIEGIITDLPSNTYFEVNGVPVSINSQTKINPNVRLILDAVVRISGQFDVNGVLVANHVQAK